MRQKSRQNKGRDKGQTIRQGTRMAWYVILLLILAGVLLAREGRSQKQEKCEEDFPALSWIREQEQEDVKEIEKKLNAKEQAEQIKDPAKLDKGSLKERFRNAVLVGDSVATGFLDYEILDSTSIVALRGLRTDTAGPEIEKALELAPEVMFLSIGLNDLEYCRGDSGLFISRYTARIQEIREQAPKLPIYVNSILPVLPEAVEKKPFLAQVDAFNGALESMCEEQDLVFIDNSQMFQDHADWYQKDAVHLKSAPYPLWLEQMEEAAGL